MEPTTKPARSDIRLLVAADRDQPTDAAFQCQCGFGMGEAIALEEASRSIVIRLNSCVLEICENVSWFTPVFGGLFYMAAKSIAFCIELQMNGLTMFAPHAVSNTSAVSGSSDNQVQPTAEELADSMDIALGQESLAPSGRVMGNSGSHGQPTVMVPDTWTSRAA